MITFVDIDTTKIYPYFFKNETINNNTYIIQQCNSVEQALYIIDVWNKNKINIGNDDEYGIDTKKLSFILHMYNTNNNIEKELNNNSTNNPYDYNVMIFKKNNKIYYNAMLLFI